ncbi:MAG: SpoIIE family protein phosphatase [Bacteroidetes bacterium]|jgi:sigma-B regulation protein RsbU (phosphoserine phosphatase)|nr:SpoIIE family protein phosphatase [Bacteroidota bacterium]
MPTVREPSTIRILVVDDEPDLELLIRQRFRKQRRTGAMDFSFASDGVEALEHLDADRTIDIVLSDINMPRMDGLTLLEKLHDRERPPKVVIVSAYGDMSNIRTAMNRGAFDFVTKPIDFEDLGVTIRKTYEELRALRKADQLQEHVAAMQRELNIASRIQLSSLPPPEPAFLTENGAEQRLDLRATLTPAREVGGDFYDYFLIDEDHLGFALGDVSGKGIGAALFMAITRTMLRATALQGLPPDACLRHVNRVLHPESMPQMFVTLVYGVLDLTTGAVTYANAGHHPPYVLREKADAEAQTRGGLALCVLGEFAYEAATLTLQPGDGLFLFTDGVSEAADGNRALFGEERLDRSLQQRAGGAPAEVIRHVLRAVDDFTLGAPPSDDVTMLALRYQPHGNP